MSLETGRRVLQEEADAIRDLIPRLGESFNAAVEALAACQGRVVVSGMGKSGLIGGKIAATLASTGTPALFMHPAEAIHGDIGMVVPGDLVLGISASGETEEMVRLLELLKRLGVPLISLTGSLESTLARYSLVALDVGVGREAGSLGLVPTSSTTAALAMGDALAVAVLERKGFTARDFAEYHPGGRIGITILTVQALMHPRESTPRVSPAAKMVEVVGKMSAGKMGMTCVEQPDGTLAGIITDGDLRRCLEKGANLLQLSARDCMTASAVTILGTETAARALHLMETRKITSLVVISPERRIEGLLHIHDLWRT
ncbi:MAG TPA: KpsF/GutQ family sugar-phosphate isomerase, partial [Candidatus Polarisedimenticolia bacterium]|nr:KpsF/GutQ family sugar-phosphate isomerase [Candidatus Polarisedimenticolia bacterium]